jgi:FKBP-type peptidyl-prolyl cis-trans isomerase
MTPRALVPHPRSAAAPLVLLLLVFAFALAGCGDDAPEAADVENIGERPVEERALYLAAFEIGEQIRQQDSTFNVDAFLQGLRAGFEVDSASGVPYALGYQQGLELAIQTRADTSLSPDLSLYVAGFMEGFEGRERRLTAADIRTVQEEMQMRQLRRDAATDPQAQAYLEELQRSEASADSFLTANAARDSVQTTASGLQYVVLQPGTGESPEEGDRVLVTYTGTLVDGTPFDGSEGQPVDFEIGEDLIAGMNEALTSMRVGERRRLYIPPALGYGMQGVPRSLIRPNSVLVFDLTLNDVLDPVPEQGQGTQAPAVGEPQVLPQGQ